MQSDSHMDFMRSPQMEEARRRQELEISQRLGDWQEILDMAGGQRLVHWLLQSLGIGRRIGPGQEEAALYNKGIDLLEEIGRASPMQCRNLLAQLFINQESQ